MPRQTLEQKLAELSMLASETLDAEAVDKLRKALAGASNILAARAAAIAAECGGVDLAPDLMIAFHRFMDDPVKRDKGCVAKRAIVEALFDLGIDDDEIYLDGARHFQLEPSYGAPVDTADRLRGLCCRGLARVGHPGLLFEVVALLNDPQPATRRDVVDMLGSLPRDESELLLRMKALAGDADVDVTADCLSALMRANARRSLSFVARFLDDDDPNLAEGAALALGESREAGALAALRRKWADCFDQHFRRRLLLPIALHRSDESFEFLLDVIREQTAPLAAEAVKAARVSAVGEDRLVRLREAVGERDEAAVSAVYREEFGGEL